ncbi:hypothetical protein MAR_022397 [Mya arenaria]|uniref:Uncharacterized protein n=1 Tax=Mya arenaria TaxID=6604 RepID=A0ABY7DK03_MYAAR|nr:hypothetical protein MAR_022397 [Mya arenaria]
MTIVWNQPQLSKRISSEDIRIINEIKTCVQTYTTRAMQKEFGDTKMRKFLLRSDDPKLVLDLRKNNGRVKDPQYDAFWKERIWMKKKSGFEKNATKVICTVCVLDFIEFYASQPLQGICSNIQCETSSAAKITTNRQQHVPASTMKVTGECSLLTLDHDYNLCGIVSSVCLLVDIPTNSR